eukprot:gene9106-10678_t
MIAESGVYALLCELPLLGGLLCQILQPLVITTVTVLKNNIDLQALLDLSSVLTIKGNLLCNSTINLLGGTLIVEGTLEIKPFCRIFVSNSCIIKSSNLGLYELFLSFNDTGGNSVLNWDGDVDISLASLIAQGSEQPKMNFASNNIKIRKGLTATVASIAPIARAVFDSVKTVSLADVEFNNLSILNAGNPLVIGVKVSNLTLTNTKVSGLNGAMSMISATSSSIVSFDQKLTVASVLSTASLLNISHPLVSITNALFTNSNVTLLAGSVLSIGSHTITGSPINLALNSALNLLSGAVTNSPISLLSNSVLSIAGITRLSGSTSPITGGLVKLSENAILSLGGLLDPITSVVRLDSQLTSSGGFLRTNGKLSLAQQNSPVGALGLIVDSLVVDSGLLSITNGSLKLGNSVNFLVRGTLSLTGSVLNLAAPGLLDVVADVTDLVLKDVVLTLTDNVLPTRLLLGPNSSLDVRGLLTDTVSAVDESLYTVVYSPDTQINCNGDVSGSSTSYEFVCDSRMIAVRFSNCSGTVCPGSGLCVSNAARCPVSGLCTTPSNSFKCWNDECAINSLDCPPVLPCAINERRCEDGSCIPSISTCPPCSGSSCSQFKYNGCPTGTVQCTNGGCASDVASCCTVGTDCSMSASLTKAIETWSPFNSSRETIMPMISRRAGAKMAINGYITVPKDFFATPIQQHIQINTLDDSYLDSVNGTDIWGTGNTHRESAQTMLFDISIVGQSNPSFSKPIEFEFKLDDVASGLNVSEINLAFINVTANQWQRVENVKVCGSNNKSLCGKTDHFTSFAVLLDMRSKKPPTSTTTSPTTFVTRPPTTSSSTTGGGDGTTGDGTTSDGTTSDGTTTQGTSGKPTSTIGNQEQESSEGTWNKNLIIIVASTAGAVAVVGVIAGFFIVKIVKHGSLRFWWATRGGSSASGNSIQLS